jgi:hypothetical protein
VSYAPNVLYDPINTDIAHLVLYADSDQSRRAELVNAFGEVFQQFDVLEDEEIESARNRILARWLGPLTPSPADQNVIELKQSAMDWILGNEYESLESQASQLNSVTVDEVTSFARDVQANAMFALPGGASILPCFGEMAPASMAPIVHGQRAKNMDAPIETEELVHGPDGVSIVCPHGSHYTVRFSDLAAALSYEDGRVFLIGRDAAGIIIEPTLWRDGPSICREIREQVPAELLIDQGARPAGAIPKPTTTAWQRFRARLLNLWHGEDVWTGILKWIIFLFFIGLIRWVLNELFGW